MAKSPLIRGSVRGQSAHRAELLCHARIKVVFSDILDEQGKARERQTLSSSLSLTIPKQISNIGMRSLCQFLALELVM